MEEKKSKNDALRERASRLKATPRDDQEAKEAVARANAATGCSKDGKPEAS